MAVTQAAETQQFPALHEAADAFVIANVMGRRLGPDDGRLGFPRGRPRAELRRVCWVGGTAGSHAMRHWSRRPVTCEATDLPVSADLEKGFGDAPEFVAETERR